MYLSPKHTAVLAFAVKATYTPAECDEAELAQLGEAGFADEEVLHIVEVTAIFKNNVRLATATGLFPSPEYPVLGRVPSHTQ